MAKQVARHWQVTSLFLAALLAVAAAWLIPGAADYHTLTSATAQGEPAAADATPATEPGLYRRVRGLRAETGLSSDALAAYGVGGVDAEPLLDAVRWWVEGHAAALDAADAAVARARGEAEAAYRAWHSGELERVSDLRSKRDALTSAMGSRRDLVEAFTAHVGSAMPLDAKRRWETCLRNAGLGLPRSMLHLTGVDEAQAKGLIAAERERRREQLRLEAEAYRRPAPAPAPGSGAGAGATSVDGVLTASQARDAADARARQANNLPGVLAAERAVLPPPRGDLDPTPQGPAASP